MIQNTSSEIKFKFSEFFKNYKRIIIKVGSALLVDNKSGKINEAWLESLAKDIVALISLKKDVKYLNLKSFI